MAHYYYSKFLEITQERHKIISKIIFKSYIKEKAIAFINEAKISIGKEDAVRMLMASPAGRFPGTAVLVAESKDAVKK